MDGCRRSNDIIALFRQNHKSKDPDNSHVFEEEEAMQRRPTAQESWKEWRMERIWPWFALGNRPGGFWAQLR
jgi:hypothetical protein